MFFSRRKHVAPVVTAPAVPKLTDELIFQAVQDRLDGLFGENGDWTVVRRSGEQADRIFHEVFVHSVAQTVTAGITAARDSLETRPGALTALRAPRVPQPAPEAHDEDEPAALSWRPAPITVWADLKRPVTGPVAVVDGEDKAA
jgi:hypothetical protein